jgi:hypothetical protein
MARRLFGLNKIYRVTGKLSSTIPINVIGDPVSVTIKGAECIGLKMSEITTNDLADLAPSDSPFILEGIYNFTTIPRFIEVSGTGDGFEITNANITLNED